MTISYYAPRSKKNDARDGSRFWRRPRLRVVSELSPRRSSYPFQLQAGYLLHAKPGVRSGNGHSRRHEEQRIFGQVEAARALAEILMAEKNDNARIETAYQRALARKPTAKERRTLKAFLQRERKRFNNESNQADPFLEVGLHPSNKELDPSELAALTSLSRAVLNLHETITRY